jgi:ribosomal protein L4
VATKSFRNIKRVRVITAAQSNTYDLVDNAALVLTKPALEYLEGVLA